MRLHTLLQYNDYSVALHEGVHSLCCSDADIQHFNIYLRAKNIHCSTARGLLWKCLLMHSSQFNTYIMMMYKKLSCCCKIIPSGYKQRLYTCIQFFASTVHYESLMGTETDSSEYWKALVASVSVASCIRSKSSGNAMRDGRTVYVH